MNELLHWLVLLSCFGLVLGYICRLKSINFRTTRWDYVTIHVVWLAYAGWVFSETWSGRQLSFELLPLVGAYLWLEISLYSWRVERGPPRHMLREKALQELEPDVLRQVVGGKK
jgi:hypothetical protein